MKTILAIALGGGLGAVLRYGANMTALRMMGPDFPWGTLFVNVSGSLIIGLLAGIFASYWQPSPEIRAFLVTGILGGYTTFSTFSLDFSTFWEGGATGTAIAYALISVIFSILALFAGLLLVRMLAT